MRAGWSSDRSEDPQCLGEMELTASMVKRTEDSRPCDTIIVISDSLWTIKDIFMSQLQCELLTEVVSFLESLSREELNLGLMFALQ